MSTITETSQSLIPQSFMSSTVLKALEVRDLYSSFRVIGISLNQVEAAIEYACFCNVCYEFELIDLMKELDRRYFLIQDLRWEFSALDISRTDLLPVASAQYLMQMVHKNLFSKRRWNNFVTRRPFPEYPVSFAEIEVELCSIPSLSDVEDEITEEIIEEIIKVDNSANEKAERKRRKKEEAIEAKRIAKEAAERERELQKLLELEREVSDSGRLNQLQQEMDEQRHRKVRYKLKNALKEKTKPPLKKAIHNFENEKLDDTDGDLEKGKFLLDVLEAKERLLKAIESKDINAILEAMKYITKRGFERKLEKEMQFADLMVIRLRRLERIRAEVLKLNQPTVAELKSYSFPPPQVHQVMTATFLILGHTEKECKDWRTVQILIGKTGKDGLKRRCLGMEPNLKHRTLTKKAAHVLRVFDLEAVRDISAGAATFYLWCQGIIEEVESLVEESKVKE